MINRDAPEITRDVGVAARSQRMACQYRKTCYTSVMNAATLMGKLDRHGKIRPLTPETVGRYVANSAGEMYFWFSYFRTKGGSQWSKEYAKWSRSEFDIPAWVGPYVAAVDPLTARVLDVGSGPISRDIVKTCG